MVSWLKDESLRGSPVDMYGNVAGIRHDEWEAKGDVYLDTFPYLIRAVMGNPDSITASPASTTLSASAAAGAASVALTASVATGSWIVIGGIETHQVKTGGTSAVLWFPLVNAFINGTAVTGKTGHQIGLFNSASVGSQPPSYTIVHFDGAVGRQLVDAQADTLGLSFSSDQSLAWTSKFLTFPETDIPTPTNEAFSSQLFVPGYSCTVNIAGTTSSVVSAGEVNFSRGTEAITTANSGLQTPYRIFAGPITCEGKLTFVVETNDPTILNGTTSVKQVLNLLFTDPKSDDSMTVQMSQVQFENPKINSGKTYVEVDTDFVAEANATDAVSGGYAPAQFRFGNAITTSF